MVQLEHASWSMRLLQCFYTGPERPELFPRLVQSLWLISHVTANLSPNLKSAKGSQ